MQVLENYTDVNEVDEGTYSVDKELEDDKLRHEITLQFAAFSAVEKTSPLPTSLYFTFQFYDAAPTRTERLVLRSSSRSDENDHTVARVLCREKVRRSARRFAMIIKNILNSNFPLPSSPRLAILATLEARKTRL